jgi:mannan polymerase II complex MNN10 subunit
MEPSYSLQSHIFNHLARNVYRDINHYNPLNITHPPVSPILDPISSSPSGDNSTASIDLVITQDCSGFNLGSFFTRRSAFTERLFDIWWDPVLYEQKHMEWEHKEQDALEHLYSAQPYLRSHIAFLEQRKVNSFPSGACPVETAEEEQELIKAGKKHQLLDQRYHYNEADRDFMVNMAGCEWGRDCWQEMYTFRELSNRLNRTWWERLKDAVVDTWRWVWAPRVVELEEQEVEIKKD